MEKTDIERSQAGQQDADSRRNQKEVSFFGLSVQALPEMWTFQILAGLLLAIPAALLTKLIDWIAGIGGDAVTTANFKAFIISWRFPVILFLALLLVLVYLVIELLSQIYLTDDILNGRRAGIRRCIGIGIRSLKRFMNPYGIGVILFILIVVPLCGVGFTLSLSETFRLPNFIMAVIRKNLFFHIGYIVLMVYLVWLVFRSSFTLHAVLLDGMKPSEGRKYSSRIVKENRWRYLGGLILTGLVILGINVALYWLFTRIPGWVLGGYGESLPKDYTVDPWKIVSSGTMSDMDLRVVIYRVCASFFVLAEKYLLYITVLLSGAYFMLRINRYYLEFTGRGRQVWPERPKKARYFWKIILILLVFVLVGLLSVVLGLYYDPIFVRKEPVKIIAHRTGGNLASENSIEGIEKAIEHGCYGFETDIQRTKDGFYIINHDNDFKRLTGVARAPKYMTMDEIRKLRIRDTTGNGQEHPVPTLEEMLDAVRGRGKLFVELKGSTADRQMVDDAVRIIREHDCVEDTVLISLHYDVIKYAETTYPEFETGTLFFAGLGNLSRMNCDLMLMEEDAATEENIERIHDGGKQAVVWTVNSKDGMHHFLDTQIDAIITDEIEMAQQMQEAMDGRTDLEVIEDKLSISFD